MKTPFQVMCVCTQLLTHSAASLSINRSLVLANASNSKRFDVRLAEPDAVINTIGYAKFRSRSHDAVIRVYDAASNVSETHEHIGDFKEQ
jgi:hypothetical protein